MADVALVDGIEVGEHDDGQCGHGKCGRKSAAHVEHDEHETKSGDDKRPDGVGRDQSVAQTFDSRVDGRILEAELADGRGVVALLRELGGDHAVDVAVVFSDDASEHRGGYESDCADGEGDTEAPENRAAVGVKFVAVGDELLERHGGKERHGELGDYKNAFDSAEFGIHRDDRKHDVGEDHGVASPGEHDGEDRQDQQRPFHRAADDHAAQEEEGEDEGADIDRSVGSLRVSEILAHVAEILLLHGVDLALGHHLFCIGQVGEAHDCHTSLLRPGGSASLDVGDQQRECLGGLIAVLGDVVLVESGGGVRGVGRGLCQLAVASAHGLFGIFVGEVEAR